MDRLTERFFAVKVLGGIFLVSGDGRGGKADNVTVVASFILFVIITGISGKISATVVGCRVEAWRVVRIYHVGGGFTFVSNCGGQRKILGSLGGHIMGGKVLVFFAESQPSEHARNGGKHAKYLKNR